MRLVVSHWISLRKIFLFTSFLRRHIYFVLESNISSDVKLFIGKSSLSFVSYVLKTTAAFRYDILCDICIVDMPDKEKRYRAVYNFLSTLYGTRAFLNIYLVEATLVNSLKTIYSSSGWLEREVWDMFGIYFYNHYDLRRLLTDYGFQGFPLKKDFPLTGYLEVRYDEPRGDVVYEPVELTQELRFFNFSSG